jgi:hypothetical protein
MLPGLRDGLYCDCSKCAADFLAEEAERDRLLLLEANRIATQVEPEYRVKLNGVYLRHIGSTDVWHDDEKLEF